MITIIVWLILILVVAAIGFWVIDKVFSDVTEQPFTFIKFLCKVVLGLLVIVAAVHILQTGGVGLPTAF